MNEITKGVWYIGVDDCELDLFEGLYRVPHGVSYNSYLIVDDRVAIMDSVDSRKCDEWLALLDIALSGRKPDYLVVQHMEPDHTGSLLALVQRYPDIAIVATQRAIDMLPQFFEDTALLRNLHPVQEGDTLPLGEHTLQFITAPMVHWPEVMVTYEQSERVLFSADAFGRFGTLDRNEAWDDEARRYYYNIVGKYGAQVQALLAKASQLDIATIASLHGPILREGLEHYIGKYKLWSSYAPEERGVLILCASIYGNTLRAAQHLAATLEREHDMPTRLLDLTRCDHSTALAEAFRYEKLVVAASTYDGGVFTPMDNLLRQLAQKGLRARRVAIIENGSWAPMAARHICDLFASMRDITIIEPIVTLRGALKSSDIDTLKKLAEQL